jgi:hypothetical protein
MIEIIDNNDVINEFYNLIEPDLLGMPKGCLVIDEPVIINLISQESRRVHHLRRTQKQSTRVDQKVN